MGHGGVPERSNGAVLKTAGGRKVARGFKSHPRRHNKRNPPSQAGFGLLRAPPARLPLEPWTAPKRWHVALASGHLPDVGLELVLDLTEPAT
jgi:hypothetical protein